MHRDLKLENILLSQPVGNELLNIKVGLRNMTVDVPCAIIKIFVSFIIKIYITWIWAGILGMFVK